MDSERRHELETNDLREFLDNFKDFWEKHGNKILLVLIVGLGGFAAYNYYNQWKDGKAEEAYNQLAAATTVDALLAVADEHSLVHDEAMRRAGDLALGSARNSLIQAEASSAKESLKDASSAYEALAKRGETVEYQLVGYEGLAKVAIMSGEWDKAKTNYEKLIELAGEAHPAQAGRAEAGLEQLELIRYPVAFAPDDDLSFNPDEESEDDDGSAEDDDGSNKPVDPVESFLPDPLIEGFDQLNPAGD